MAENGSIIAAFRLPESLFDNATITVDIVLYQKGVKNSHSFANINHKVIDGYSLSLNEYFINNPSHILGKLTAKKLYGKRMGL
ncbi:hypothetical protein OAO18_08185, partial [Francisellaceae bacterium]|nr:hypothetical protein [Francisellaceae bacterium]